MPVTNRFTRTLTKDDFGATGTIVLPVNTWTLLKAFTIPAQQEIRVGVTEVAFGAPQGQVAYIQLATTATTSNLSLGRIRIQVVDANGQGYTILEKSMAQWAASQTDRTLGLLIPMTGVVGQEDSRIEISVYQTIAATANNNVAVDMTSANTIMSIPVTIDTIRGRRQ